MGIASVVCSSLTFGAQQVFAPHGDASIVLTATPEDPCLLNHTCGLENQIAEDEAAGRKFQAFCDELKLKRLTIPECKPA